MFKDAEDIAREIAHGSIACSGDVMTRVGPFPHNRECCKLTEQIAAAITAARKEGAEDFRLRLLAEYDKGSPEGLEHPVAKAYANIVRALPLPGDG